MLLEETITKPGFQALAGVSCVLEQAREYIAQPALAISISQQIEQSIGGSGLASNWRDANDTILVRQRFQAIRAERRAIGETGTGLARPLVTTEPSYCNLQWVVRILRVAIEKPLRRVAGKRLRQGTLVATSVNWLARISAALARPRAVTAISCAVSSMVSRASAFSSSGWSS